jgi:hypothetical protein
MRSAFTSGFCVLIDQTGSATCRLYAAPDDAAAAAPGYDLVSCEGPLGSIQRIGFSIKTVANNSDLMVRSLTARSAARCLEAWPGTRCSWPSPDQVGGRLFETPSSAFAREGPQNEGGVSFIRSGSDTPITNSG